MKNLIFALIALFGFTSVDAQAPVTKTEAKVDFNKKEIKKTTTVVKPKTTVDFENKRIIRRTATTVEPTAELEKKKYIKHKKKYLKHKKHAHKHKHHKRHRNHGHKVREVAKDR